MTSLKESSMDQHSFTIMQCWAPRLRRAIFKTHSQTRQLFAIVIPFVISVSALAQEQNWIVPQETNVDASFRGLAVVDQDEAWVSGSKGVVIRTVDRGATWSRIRIPKTDELDFRDVALPEKNIVLLMSAGAGDKSQVFRSIDSGKSWTNVLINQDDDGFFNAFTFFDSQNGILIGDPINGRLDVYRTSDGGTTWMREQGPAFQDGEYGFAASGTNVTTVAPNHVWIASGGSIARVFRLSDSQKTWMSSETPMAQGNDSSGIFSVAFRDPFHGVIVGGDYKNPESDNGNIAHTADGGKTWTLANPKGKVSHKACVRHIGEKRWISVGRTGVAISDDDGATWKQVSDQGYFTFDVNGETFTGWMAGSDGRVARFTWPQAPMSHRSK